MAVVIFMVLDWSLKIGVMLGHFKEDWNFDSLNWIKINSVKYIFTSISVSC